MESEKKLRVFGVSYMVGDENYMAPFLDRTFTDPSLLKEELDRLYVVLAQEPFLTTLDTETGLVVRSFLLTHKNGGWQVGSLDLVEADEQTYVRLKQSAGHIDQRSLSSAG